MDIRAIQPLPSTPFLNAIPASSSSDDPSTALRVRPQPTDAERAQFKKAATEFESFFLYYMLKTMRQAIPKGGLLDSKVGDTYLGLLDQEVANQAAKQGGFGLGKSLETQMFPAAPRHLSFLEIPPIKSTEEEGP
jgi:Rod binding domain-containing protein